MPEILSPDQADATSPLPAPATQGRGRDVVVVDPDPGVRRVIGLVLDELGCITHSADDAESALKLIREVRPALVLAEVRLHGPDGVELVRRIREQETEPPRIVLMSAYPRPREVPESFLPKPLRFERLLDLAREAISA